jgi:hypothetical protein
MPAAKKPRRSKVAWISDAGDCRIIPHPEGGFTIEKCILGIWVLEEERRFASVAEAAPARKVRGDGPC